MLHNVYQTLFRYGSPSTVVDNPNDSSVLVCVVGNELVAAEEVGLVLGSILVTISVSTVVSVEL